MFGEAREAFGRVDLLVNNAGVTRDGLLIRMSEQDYDQVLDTNLTVSYTHLFTSGGRSCFFCRP